MANKPRRAQRELSIDEKKKRLTSEGLAIGLFMGVLALYIGMAFEKVRSSMRGNFSEITTEMKTRISEDPFFVFPIDYNIGLGLTLFMLAILFVTVEYTYLMLKVNSGNKTKGKTFWADPFEITSRYAEGVKEKFLGIFNSVRYDTAYNNQINSQNVYQSLDTRVHFHALNTFIIGTTGSGKTRYVIKPNILQLNSSFVCCDPKGSTASAEGEMLRRFGYNVKIFDIFTKSNCNTYNPLKYVHREDDVRKLAVTFAKTTDPSGGKASGKDPFWDDSMTMLMCGDISLLCLIPEGETVPYAQNPKIMGDMILSPCLANVAELTRIANKKWTPQCGIPLLPGVKLGDGKNNTANASRLSAIFENIRAYEAEKQDVSPAEIEKPYCLECWEEFCLAPEKTSTTVLMTAATKLNVFDIKEVRDLTNTDTIELDKFGEQRDALFLIIPPNDSTYNFLTAFLYAQLFDILYRKCNETLAGSSDLYIGKNEFVKHFSKEEVVLERDKEFLNAIKENKVTAEKVDVSGKHTFSAKDDKGKNTKVTIDDSYYEIKVNGQYLTRRPTKKLANDYIAALKKATLRSAAKEGFSPLPIHFKFYQDEFPNTGKIEGYQEILSTVREYNISCTIVIQDLTQLKGMYQDTFEVIDGNCPQVIFLGGDGNTTVEYLSKKMGDSTKVTASNSINDGEKINFSHGVDGGALMRPEDFGRIDPQDQLLFIFGEMPIIDKKYDLVSHPTYKYTYDYIQDMDKASKVYSFDRTKLSAGDDTNKLKVRKPRAVPHVEEFTVQTFREIMGKFSTSEACDALRENYENYAHFSDDETSDNFVF